MGARAMAAAVATAAAVLGFAGCGGGGGERTVEITARFSRFTPSTFEAAPGETVKLVVRNLDPIAHELIIGDGEVHRRHATGTEPWHPAVPGEVSVPANATRATTFTFPDRPGEVVEFGCHLPGHWDYGMRGTATVA